MREIRVFEICAPNPGLWRTQQVSGLWPETCELGIAVKRTTTS
jgi:hypothetical protein